MKKDSQMLSGLASASFCSTSLVPLLFMLAQIRPSMLLWFKCNLFVNVIYENIRKDTYIRGYFIELA